MSEARRSTTRDVSRSKERTYTEEMEDSTTGNLSQEILGLWGDVDLDGAQRSNGIADYFDLEGLPEGLSAYLVNTGEKHDGKGVAFAERLGYKPWHDVKLRCQSLAEKQAGEGEHVGSAGSRMSVYVIPTALKEKRIKAQKERERLENIEEFSRVLKVSNEDGSFLHPGHSNGPPVPDPGNVRR